MNTPPNGTWAPSTAFDRQQPCRRNRTAFTLLEVMIGLFVFVVACLSVLGGLIQSRKLAENNLMKETALTLAQSYLEDIKGGTYLTLTKAATTTAPLDTRVALRNNITTTLPPFDYRGTPTNSSDDMIITLTPILEKIPNLAADKQVDAYSVRLNYTWRVGSINNGTSNGVGTLRTIRSNMAPLVITVTR